MNAMKFVYLILAHKNPFQLERLIRRLNEGSPIFIVHIDKKVGSRTYQQYISIIKKYNNVRMTKNRYNVYRFRLSMVNATLECINELVAMKEHYDYAFLISESHYPIKSINYFYEYLSKYHGNSFIDGDVIPRKDIWLGENGGMDRIDKWHYFVFEKCIVFPPKYLGRMLNRMNIHIRRVFQRNCIPYGGSQWWCFNRECIDYIYNYVYSNREFLEYFKHSLVPDEIFFHTIIYNSQFKNKIMKNSLVYTNWSDAEKSRPRTLEMKDYELIAKSDKLFARKFDIIVDSDILDMIDNKLINVVS